MKIKLKALRVNADLTQDDVAKMMNISRETLMNWEAHRTFPNIVSLNKLCDIYSCTLDDIFIPSSLTKSE